MEAGQTPGRPNQGQCVWLNKKHKAPTFKLKVELDVANEVISQSKEQDLFYLEVKPEGDAYKVVHSGLR